MTSTITTEGQSLVDVAIQELGSVEALFDLADANDLAITDLLTPGQVLVVPDSVASVPALVSYFSGRSQRINTGDEALTQSSADHDFDKEDFDLLDFDTQ